MYIEIPAYSIALISLLLFSLHFSLRESLLHVLCVFGGYHILPTLSTPLEEDLQARYPESPSQETGALG